MSLHNLALEEKARTLVGCEVEVLHARPDMGPFDEPFRCRGMLRSVDGRFLCVDNQWIALSTVESIKVVSDRQSAIND
ncbi:MAG: hypothetical protein GDYSWBUE_002206 [Candidatus Fervidibacterota bacterium]